MIKPQDITIKPGKFPLSILLWDIGANETLLFMGGSGDGKHKFDALITQLFEDGFNKNVITTSYKGVDEKIPFPLKEQTTDLVDVLKWMKKNFNQPVTLLCTSMGAFSITHVITQPELKNIADIEEVIYLDPADYYLSDADKMNDQINSWRGNEKFLPREKVASDLLKNADLGSIKIHIINLLIRNFTKHGYVKPEERHIDNPKLFPRLNQDMVMHFYNNIPQNNKGEYIENYQIPHAFIRDGDLQKNVKMLSELLRGPVA